MKKNWKNPELENLNIASTNEGVDQIWYDPSAHDKPSSCKTPVPGEDCTGVLLALPCKYCGKDGVCNYKTSSLSN